MRYAAFLRGVSPMNLKMADLKKALEAGGVTEVKTVLASGNAVFSARAAPIESLQRRVEAAMMDSLGRTFLTIIRSVDALRELLASDPYRGRRLKLGSKRVVTFLRDRPTGKLELPIEYEGARILSIKGREIFTAYVPNPKKGAAFMTLIEKTFGKEATTRTWETVAKVAR
jgi:uncharacterized protein (DUF1697 family)